jgi:hypothetical protein
MHWSVTRVSDFFLRRTGRWILPILAFVLPLTAQALPTFARQTGQNCVSCHAGGQFPELTPYGRLFKLTAYTIGQRNTIPLSVMGVASFTKTKNTTSDTKSVDFPKDVAMVFQTGSVFIAGKITDNIGLFSQITYDNYANQNLDTLAWAGHSHADNIDVRYADRFIDNKSDVIVGVSVNNNPSVSDVWNTVPAWIQYVPTRFGFTGPKAAPMIAQLGQQVVGVNAYGFWNQMVYAELGAYKTKNGMFSFFGQGNDLSNRLKGANPYMRIALNHEWGAHNMMIGAFGMNASVFPDPTSPVGPTTSFRDRGVDAQYQYLLDPHTVTAQMSYIHEHIGGGDVSGITANANNSLNQFRAKASYIYRTKYGASLSYFRTNGSQDSTLYPGPQDDGTGTGAKIATPLSGSATNNPDTRGWTPEIFWTPVQNVRVGAQSFLFNHFNGASSNYDGAGRNAHDNNTFFTYVWVAY